MVNLDLNLIIVFGHTGELAYGGPLYAGLLAVTDDMLGLSPMHISSMCHMYTTDFVYDVPFSWSHWVRHMQVHMYFIEIRVSMLEVQLSFL